MHANKERKNTVAIGNPERHMRKASHCGSKQQQNSHAMITLLLLVRATYMYGVVLHAHPVRGESHNQRNTTGKVATTSLPFYNEPHRSHVLCVKAELRTTFTSWSQDHFVAIGNPEQRMHKASTVAASNNRVHVPWSHYHCLIAPHICMVLFFTHIPFVVNHTINATPPEILQQYQWWILNLSATLFYWAMKVPNHIYFERRLPRDFYYIVHFREFERAFAKAIS